jgi:hypothetical protein
MKLAAGLSAVVAVVLLVGRSGAGQPPAATVVCQIKTPGAVSLGIYDAQGRLLRTLQSGKKVRAAGAYSVAWDGKDDVGTALPPGEYRYRGLSANVGWKYQLTMGNSGRPPYLTADGSGGMGGVWGNVVAAAADSTGKLLYALWAMEEGTPSLCKFDPHGGEGSFKLWGAHDSWSWGPCQALACDRQYVYVGINALVDDPAQKGKKLARGQIWRVNADNGEYANSYPGSPTGLLAVSEIPAESLPKLPHIQQMYADPDSRRSDGFATNLFALAADASRLYCSLHAENQVLVLDKRSGRRLLAIPVTEPAGLAIAPDGNLYAISGCKVLEYSPQGKLLATVIAAGLAAPYGLCVDAQGQIYVSDQAAAMQVKVFRPTGELVRSIGKAGGRAYGGQWAKMRPDLLFPTVPAVTADGTLYVGEDAAPKRIAIYHQDGRWADEWYGPLASGCGKLDVADEAQPEFVYQLFFRSDLVRYRVDYAAKRATLDAVWGYEFSLDHMGDPGRYGSGIKPNALYQGCRSGGYVRHCQGRTFLFTNGGPHVFRVEGYKIVPCTTIGTLVQVHRPERDTLARISGAWKSRPAMGRYPSTPARVGFYVWRDTNGDWEVQEDEVDWRLPPGGKEQLSWADSTLHGYVDREMTVFVAGWKLPLLGLDDRGNPIYSWSKAERLPYKPLGRLFEPKKAAPQNTAVLPLGVTDEGPVAGPVGPSGREVNTWVDPQDGGYYLSVDVEGKGKGINWASNGIYARIGKMDRAGRWLWMAGDKATGFAKPGQFYKPGQFAGIVDDCLFVTDWNGQYRIYDKNTGLYAGTLFNDAFRGAAPDENLISVEFNEGHVYRHPASGEVYALAGDGECLKLFRVTGLSAIERFQGTVSLGKAAP